METGRVLSVVVALTDAATNDLLLRTVQQDRSSRIAGTANPCSPPGPPMF